MIKFNDGMEFDTSGELRLSCRSDGWYVVGGGMLIPVDSAREGIEEIARIKATLEPTPEKRLFD